LELLGGVWVNSRWGLLRRSRLLLHFHYNKALIFENAPFVNSIEEKPFHLPFINFGLGGETGNCFARLVLARL